MGTLTVLMMLLATSTPELRSGEPALLIEEDASAYFRANQKYPGVMAYSFRIRPGTRRLELGFLEDLGGAKVEAVAHAGGHSFPLLEDKRLAGSQLTLEWTREGVNQVVVFVHHHLREVPRVQTWRVGRLPSRTQVPPPRAP
jgi:hypothetical protein